MLLNKTLTAQNYWSTKTSPLCITLEMGSDFSPMKCTQSSLSSCQRSMLFFLIYYYMTPILYKMNKVLLGLILLSPLILCAKISADLQIVTYEPLQFRLTFSEPTPLPKFQLLFNENPIGFQIISNKGQTASIYGILGITQGYVNPSDYITEKYVLMFTQPLTIAGGNLSLDSFLLRAHRNAKNPAEQLESVFNEESHFYFQNSTPTITALSTIIICTVYFLAYTTLIGLNAYNFLAIYAYISIRSPIYTALDYRLAYLLLFQPNQVTSDETSRFLYLLIPHLVIAVSFVVGLLSRWKLRKLCKRSGLCNYIYYYLSYKMFIISWGLMCIPIFSNVVQLIRKSLVFTEISPVVIDLYIYFSLVLIVFYSYMCFFATNPQLKQNPQQWKSYIESAHFQLFDGFHFGIDAEDWKKRNYTFVVSVIRLVILIFVSAGIIGVPNLLLQIVFLIYLFTLRPFKYDFFNYFNIGMQIFVILFYLYRYIVQLYMSISDEITTSTDISRILLSNIVLVAIIIFTYFVLGIYEFYQRLRSFRINLRKWDPQTGYEQAEQTIRKTQHSAFKNDDEDNEHKVKRHLKKKGSPTKQQLIRSKSKKLNPSPIKSRNQKLKASTPNKIDSKQAKYTASPQNPLQTEQNEKFNNENPTLMQSVRLGNRSP